MSKPLHITHVITDLEVGGAEMMLYRLLTRMDRRMFDLNVISLSGQGPIGAKLSTEGIPVTGIDFSSTLTIPVKILALARMLGKGRPDIIQTWMYHADLIGSLSSMLAGRIPVVWGIHNSTLDPALSRRRTLWIVGLLSRFSHWLPAKIISCSEAAAQIHIQKGYDREKVVVIPNGFDTEQFHADCSSRRKIRDELALDEQQFLVGIIARFDPQKDHLTFLKAAAQVKERIPQAQFLLCGERIDARNETLLGWITSLDLAGEVHLLGKRDDIPALMNALDLLVVSSAYGEAFPLVCGEAMACEVSCVATDLGDSAQLIAKTGKIVKPRSPRLLAEAIIEMLTMPKEEKTLLGQQARKRIIERYSIEAVVKQYENVYESLNQSHSHR